MNYHDCEMAKCDWYFPDTFLPDTSDGISHESVCVLNVGKTDAHIKLVLYFEDRESMEEFEVVCQAGRTNHIRFDKLSGKEGEMIPRCIPYSVWLHSDVPVLCQYTRVDASLPQRTLMTTMGI